VPQGIPELSIAPAEDKHALVDLVPHVDQTALTESTIWPLDFQTTKVDI
jgi:hypothetical protein